MMDYRFFYMLAGLNLMISISPVVSYFTILAPLLEQFTGIDCTSVKEFLGVTYYQMDNKTEPTSENVSLVLYTQNGNQSKRTYFKLSTECSTILNSSKFNASLPSTIYIGGYKNFQGDELTNNITTALLKRGGMNVFTIDTGPLIIDDYFRATTNVIFIGELMGNLLADCFRVGLNRNKVHLIGFSLGAHIAGVAAMTFNQLTNFKIPHITGLDPAGPCYYSANYSYKLDKTDAEFVDIIHSDIGVLGISQLLGHANFFPNNGRKQPNALTTKENHRRAFKLYVESIYFPTNLPAVPCTSWLSFLKGYCSSNPKAYMGYDVSLTTRGNYYLRTNGIPLYGMGDKGARPDDNPLKAYSAWLAEKVFG